MENVRTGVKEQFLYFKRSTVQTNGMGKQCQRKERDKDMKSKWKDRKELLCPSP
jgi:hypothetical protein